MTERHFITTEIDLPSLAEWIASQLNHDAIFWLISEVDSGLQDWDFTLRLCKHFKKLEKEFKKECAK